MNFVGEMECYKCDNVVNDWTIYECDECGWTYVDESEYEQNQNFKGEIL